METRYAVLLVCGLLLLSVGVVTIGPASATDGSPTFESSDGENGPNVTIDPAIANAEGTTTVTVLVRLEDRSERLGQATTADQQAASLRAHAAGTQSAFERFAAGNPHVEIERQFWVTNAMLVTVDTDRIDLERLGAVDHVTEIHDNAEVRAHGGVTAASSTTAAPTFGNGIRTVEPGPTLESATITESGTPYTPGLEAIGVPETWSAFENRGEGVRVAVLDTGVDAGHPDIDLAAGGWAEFDDGGNVIDSEPHDSGYHGTHVSGTIAGGDGSGRWIGVAPDVELLHGKVLDGDGGTSAQVIAGIEWAIENDADVISMSLGANGYNPVFVDSVRNAERAGTLVVAASGNDGVGTSSSPGNVYESVAVGATDASDTVAGFSGGEAIGTDDAWGETAPDDWPDGYVVPDVTAPGVDVYSTIPEEYGYGTGYGRTSGTSMATPHVSGAVALVLSNADEELSPTEIRDLFESTAVDVGDAERRQGAGRIDAYGAMLTHSRDTLEPAFTPATATVSEPTTIAVEADHPVESYRWAFEDGTTETTVEPTVEHAFTAPGSTTVSVTLADARGETTATTDVDVVDDVSPTAVLEVPATVTTATNVTFDARNSSDNHGIDRYEWDFGDGTARTTAEPTVEHGFDESGDYTVELAVVDRSGNANATAEPVTVRTPPTVAIDSPEEGATVTDRNVTLEYALGSTDLFAADAVEYRVMDGEVPVVDWTRAPFEATADRKTATVTTDDLEDGTYAVAFRLVDGDGEPLDVETASDERSVTVETTPPALTLDVQFVDGARGIVSQRNPAVVDVSTLVPRHESTIVTVTGGDGEPVAAWDRSNETGNGETVALEWNATDRDGSPVETGTYRITAAATDDLGTVDERTTSVDVDTQAPTVTTTVAGDGIEDGVADANGTATARLDADTENVTIDLEYDDDRAGVDPSTIEFRVDGETLTDDDRTRVTASRLVHEEFAVDAGETYEIALEVADGAGNQAVVETAFAVALEGGDEAETGSDGSADGGGPSGGGWGGLPGGDGDETDDPDHTAPNAVLSLDPNPATVGEEVTFSAAESTDESWEIVSYEWAIDGDALEGELVTASFDDAGEYTVELTVENDVGESDTSRATLAVDEGEVEETADAADEADPSPADDGNRIEAEHIDDGIERNPADDDEDGRDHEDDNGRNHEDERDDGDSRNHDDDHDDELPGFGITVAIAVLLSVASLERRRRN